MDGDGLFLGSPHSCTPVWGSTNPPIDQPNQGKHREYAAYSQEVWQHFEPTHQTGIEVEVTFQLPAAVWH